MSEPTVEIRYGTSKVIDGENHISLFAEYKDENGKTIKTVEIRGDAENKPNEDLGNFLLSGVSFGNLEVSVTEHKVNDPSLKDFGDYSSNPDNLLKTVTVEEADRIVKEAENYKSVFDNAGVPYTTKGTPYEGYLNEWEGYQTPTTLNSNTFAAMFAQDVLGVDLNIKNTLGSSSINVAILRARLAAAKVADEGEKETLNIVDSIVTTISGFFTGVYNVLTSFFSADTPPQKPTATLTTKTNPLKQDVNLKKTQTTKETNDPPPNNDNGNDNDNDDGDGGGSDPAPRQLFDGWYVNYQAGQPIKRPASPTEEKTPTPEPRPKSPEGRNGLPLTLVARSPETSPSVIFGPASSHGPETAERCGPAALHKPHHPPQTAGITPGGGGL